MLHLVFAHFIGIEVLEPFSKPVRFSGILGEIGVFGLLDHSFLDEDRRFRPQGQGDGVAGPGIDFQAYSFGGKPRL